MNYLLIDGKFLSSDQPVLFFQNRSFLYGDGLFESLFWDRSRIRFASHHTERLLRGMSFFKYEIPDFLNADWVASCCKQLVEKNGFNGQAKIRMHVFRQGGAVYAPDNPQPHFAFCLIPVNPIPFAAVNCLGLFDEIRKTKSWISNFKTASSAVNVLAGIFARQNNFDDVLILNTDGNVTDSVSSNVFVYRNNSLMTPPLSDGCVDGVMRKMILKAASDLSIFVTENSIKPDYLRDADEVFVSNAITGIRPVIRFQNKTYKSEIVNRLTEQLQKHYFHL